MYSQLKRYVAQQNSEVIQSSADIQLQSGCMFKKGK